MEDSFLYLTHSDQLLGHFRARGEASPSPNRRKHFQPNTHLLHDLQCYTSLSPHTGMASFICDEKYENVIQELGRRGWELTTEELEKGKQPMDCQLIWKNLTKIKFSIIFHRFVNHFRGSSQLSNKVLSVTDPLSLSVLLLSSPSHTLRIMSIVHPIFSIQLLGVLPINILPLWSVWLVPFHSHLLTSFRSGGICGSLESLYRYLQRSIYRLSWLHPSLLSPH